MTDVDVQVRLASDTGLAEDIVVNTFTVAFAGDPTPFGPQIAGAFAAVYNGLSDHYSSSIAEEGHEVRLYLHGAPEPRVPFLTFSFEMESLPSASSLPREVAVCLSFKRTAESGENPRRRRGRVYLGPLDTGVSETSGSYVRPSGTFITDALAAFTACADYLRDEVGALFAVYSRTANAVYPIDQFWVDNEWDTQRRRGVRATSRTTSTIELP